jgi:hypothetical protein
MTCIQISCIIHPQEYIYITFYGGKTSNGGTFHRGCACSTLAVSSVQPGSKGGGGRVLNVRGDDIV